MYSHLLARQDHLTYGSPSLKRGMYRLLVELLLLSPAYYQESLQLQLLLLVLFFRL